MTAQQDSFAPARRGAMSSHRVEAFSDGVLAIAITLLVLDLVVPPKQSVPEGTLGAHLAHAWPAYFAYLVRFMVIGIIWVNHHTVFAVRQTGHVPGGWAGHGCRVTAAVTCPARSAAVSRTGL